MGTIKILIFFYIIPITLFVLFYKKVLHGFIDRQRDPLGYLSMIFGRNYVPSESYRKVAKGISIFIIFALFWGLYIIGFSLLKEIVF